MFGIGMPELIIILVIILIIFGAGKLPEIGGGMGKAIKNFKTATTEAERKEAEKIEEEIKKKPDFPLPKLHIEEYTQTLAGRSVFIACREGILRDHFHDIIADIKFLNRQGVRTTFFHNMSNRFSNQKHFRELSSRLPETRIVKVLPDLDFYHFVLDFSSHVYKIIFLERKYLIDRQGTEDKRHQHPQGERHIWRVRGSHCQCELQGCIGKDLP